MRRLGRIAGLDDVGVIDQVEIDGHPRISQCSERRSGCRPLLALGAQVACVARRQVGAVVDLLLLWLRRCWVGGWRLLPFCGLSELLGV